MKSLDDLLKPGLSFLLVEHDLDCPGANGDPSRCVCNPDVRVVDQGEFVTKANQNRAARRAAARQAAKAVAKAAKTKSKGAA